MCGGGARPGPAVVGVGCLGTKARLGTGCSPGAALWSRKPRKKRKKTVQKARCQWHCPAPTKDLLLLARDVCVGLGKRTPTPPPHLPARECCVLLHRALRDGNTM